MIVQDFSENYNGLLPDKPQSIHWTIQQATVYPVVTLQCHNKKIVVDHFVFISDDCTHDSSFVEYCADHIKKFYSANQPNITSFIKLNDGCAKQFESIKAISQLSRQPYYLSRFYFETSHEKSKSDGLGGVVKSFVSRSVNREGTVVRNARGFYQFCTENLTFQNCDGVVNNCCFILVKPEDLENSREQVAKCPYKTIPRTQKLHQIENRHSMSSGIYVRNYFCTCLPCRDQDFKNCQTISTDTFRTSPKMVSFHWFTYNRKKGDEESDSDSDAALDDDDVANSDGVFSESVSSLLQVGDIAVIRADDPVFFFYLIKVTQEETTLEKFITDDYGHTYPPTSRVVKENYHKISSEDPDQTTYYLQKNKANIFSNSIVGICPELSEIKVKIMKKEFPGFILEKHLSDGLRELCNLQF